MSISISLVLQDFSKYSDPFCRLFLCPFSTFMSTILMNHFLRPVCVDFLALRPQQSNSSIKPKRRQKGTHHKDNQRKVFSCLFLLLHLRLQSFEDGNGFHLLHFFVFSIYAFFPYLFFTSEKNEILISLAILQLVRKEFRSRVKVVIIFS